MKAPTETVWARHFQAAWHDHGSNTALPRWLRVVAFAYAHHDDGGHARFKRSELARALAEEDGEPLIRQRVSDAVAQAVDYGFLGPESMPMCLIVPLDHVKKGGLKAAGKPCPVHGRRQSRRGQTSRLKRDVQVETSRSGLDVSAKRNGSTVTFEPAPSLSVCTPSHPRSAPCQWHGWEPCPLDCANHPHTRQEPA